MNTSKILLNILISIVTCLMTFTAEAQIQDNNSSSQKQLELLVNKIWFQIDENTGTRLNTEHYYNLSGEQTVTTMHKNRNEEFPIVVDNRFYVSDSIVSNFDKSKNNTGQYLITEERINNKKQTCCYKIEELTEQLLVISRVHPTKENRKVFVIKSLLTRVNPQKQSIKEMLVGKQWFPKPGINPNPNKTFGRMRGMLYFTQESLKTNITKSHSGGGYTENQVCKYNLEVHSNNEEKNTTYIVTDMKFGTSTDKLRIGTFEILYISENMLILQNEGRYIFGNNRLPQPLERYVYVNE